MLHDIFIFFRKDRAGAIYQPASSFNGSGGLLQNLFLLCREGEDIVLHYAPFDFRIAAQRSQSGAGCIHQNTIESFPEGIRQTGAYIAGLRFDDGDSQSDDFLFQLSDFFLVAIKRKNETFVFKKGRQMRGFASRACACIENGFISFGNSK